MGKFDSTTTTTNKPLKGQLSELKKFWKEAGTLYDQGGMEYFPGSTVAERDPFSLAARGAVAELGQSEYMNSAESYMGDVLGGRFIGESNPYLDDKFQVMSDRISDQYKRIVAPTTATRFGAAGRMGSPAYNKAMNMDQLNLTEGLGRLATDVYYGDYQQERDRMDRAMAAVPGFRGAQYGDINMMRQEGALGQQYEQAQLQDQIERFNFEQMEDEMRLDRYGSRVANNLGFGTSTQHYQAPKAAWMQPFFQGIGALGGLMGGVGGMAQGFGWGAP